jgi:hypothetical protein
VNVVSGFKSFHEAPCLARKCDARRRDRPVRAYNPPRQGHGEPAKPGLLYPLVWIPCCDIVSDIPGSRSRVDSIAGDLESWVTCCDRQD